MAFKEKYTVTPVYSFTAQPGTGNVKNKSNVRKGAPTTQAAILETLSTDVPVTFLTSAPSPAFQSCQQFPGDCGNGQSIF
jgi:hypothetical protein